MGTTTTRLRCAQLRRPLAVCKAHEARIRRRYRSAGQSGHHGGRLLERRRRLQLLHRLRLWEELPRWWHLSFFSERSRHLTSWWETYLATRDELLTTKSCPFHTDWIWHLYTCLVWALTAHNTVHICTTT